jgi:Uma2 family endonuclease
VTATVLLGEMPDAMTDWLERRRVLGQDGHDEVWEGALHVVPIAHSRHGDVQMQLVELLGPRARRAGLRSVGEVNIGLSKVDFRVPDLTFIRGREHAVYLPTAAIVVEVVSPGDESYAKLGFYFARGVDEVLIVDPLRRTVEWYTRGADAFERTGRSVLLDLDEPTLHGEIDWPPA